MVKAFRFKRWSISILMVGFLIVFCMWQNNDIVITEYRYKTKKINETLDGFRIAQISDLHNKEFGRRSSRLLKSLSKTKPDIIVITGDLVDRRRTDMKAALEFIKGASQLAPIYYVTGNHEYSLESREWDTLMQGLERYQVRVLDNRIYHLEKDKEGSFYLVGLSEINLTDDTLKTLCSYADEDKLQVVLAHEPQYIHNYSQSEADIVLAGHAHGGQFRVPFLGGLVAPGQGLFPKYTSGVHRIGHTTLIISRGLGNSSVPLRLWNRPEIVIVTLIKEE